MSSVYSSQQPVYLPVWPKQLLHLPHRHGLLHWSLLELDSRTKIEEGEASVNRFVTSQFRVRAGRAAALAGAILVAAVSFTLLTSSAQTSRLEVAGTLRSNYRAAYDVLVRPSSSLAQLERAGCLVRPNFLAGIY